jgi:hypothetical protein
MDLSVNVKLFIFAGMLVGIRVGHGQQPNAFFERLAAKERATRGRTVVYHLDHLGVRQAVRLPKEFVEKMSMGTYTTPPMHYEYQSDISMRDDGSITRVEGRYPTVQSGGTLLSHSLKLYFGPDWQGGLTYDSAEKRLIMGTFLRTPGPGILSDYALAHTGFVRPVGVPFLLSRSPEKLFGWQAHADTSNAKKPVVNVTNTSGPPDYIPSPGSYADPTTWSYEYDADTLVPKQCTVSINDIFHGRNILVEKWFTKSTTIQLNTVYPQVVESFIYSGGKVVDHNLYTLMGVRRTEEGSLLDIPLHTPIADYRSNVYQGPKALFPTSNLHKVGYLWQGSLPTLRDLDGLVRKPSHSWSPMFVSILLILVGVFWYLKLRSLPTGRLKANL